MSVRVLLVGASGFIGSSINLYLKREAVTLIPTSRTTVDKDSNYVKLDIFKENTWDVLRVFKPDIVVCTAWETTHNIYWQSKTNFEYMEAIKAFSIKCFKNDVKKFIGLGSMSEYGFSPGKCNSQTTRVNPQDRYSEAKVLTSLALEKIANEFGREANWIRLFQPYGPGENNKRLIPSLFMNMSQNLPVNIRFPEHQLDFTFTKDISRFISEIIKGKFEFSINLGTGSVTSVKELTLLLAELYKYPTSKINFCSPIRSKNRTIYVDPESEIFQNGLRPEIDILNGLKLLKSSNK